MIDPGKGPGETVNGPRESRLPSGQAAGRWNFPPPLCAATINRADSDPSARTSQRTCSGSHVPGSKSRWGDRAKAAIDQSQNGSTGSAKMALPLAAADNQNQLAPLADSPPSLASSHRPAVFFAGVAMSLVHQGKRPRGNRLTEAPSNRITTSKTMAAVRLRGRMYGRSGNEANAASGQKRCQGRVRYDDGSCEASEDDRTPRIESDFDIPVRPRHPPARGYASRLRAVDRNDPAARIRSGMCGPVRRRRGGNARGHPSR